MIRDDNRIGPIPAPTVSTLERLTTEIVDLPSCCVALAEGVSHQGSKEGFPLLRRRCYSHQQPEMTNHLTDVVLKSSAELRRLGY